MEDAHRPVICSPIQEVPGPETSEVIMTKPANQALPVLPSQPPDRLLLARNEATGVEAVRARFAAHAYDAHRHDDWLVGVTERGVQDFFCRGTLPAQHCRTDHPDRAGRSA